MDYRRQANNAVERIKRVTKNEPAFQEFHGINPDQALQKILSKAELGVDDLSKGRRLLYLRTLQLWLKAELHVIMAKNSVFDGVKIDSEALMKELQESLARHLEKERLRKVRGQKPEPASEPDNQEYDLPFAAGNDLFGTVLEIFTENSAAVQMPYTEFDGREPIDVGIVEECMLSGLKNGPSTVKTLAGSIDGINDQRLGVVLSFQACLQLECDQRVVLDQLPGDVSVRIQQQHECGVHPSVYSK